MKVAVITRHAITNYGSLLQAFATQMVLEKLGCESEIINYIRDDESYQKHEITLLKRKENWYNNYIKRIAYLAIRQPESIWSGYKFEKQRNLLLKQSKKYTNISELTNCPPTADIYMTGSDQVWGCMENGNYDASYCLAFTPENARRISYAASFGHVNLTEDNKQYFKKWLSRYENIAVREESAVEIINSLGLEAFQVMDPTLLLDKDEWLEYIGTNIRKKYILVYQLHNDPKLGQYAQNVAKKKGLPLVRISPTFHQITRPGRLVLCPKISSFLSYIKNAEYMITDSFHGTAFAINFNTPFVEVLPNNNTGTRNISILKLTNLEDRILKNVNDIDLTNKHIDFESVNRILNQQRQKSIDILKKMIYK